jgi:hypothetical protein
MLVQFPISTVISDRNSSVIPAAGSVNFYLKLYNAEHNRTTPENFALSVTAVSASWEEGVGLDMENYTDVTYNKLGANWIKASAATSWTTAGGDFHANPSYAVDMSKGVENVELDVTTLVEQWIAGTKTNYGFGIRLSDVYEAASQSYYTKKFFARTSQYFHKQPQLEARWDSATRDDRADFYLSSSLVPAADNNNDLYLYNYARGKLANIPAVGTGNIYVKLYESLGGSHLTLCDSTTTATGSYVSTGIYKATVCTTSTETTLYDVWFAGSTEFHSGSISTKSHSALTYNSNTEYLITIKNLKKEYRKDENARFNLYVRPKNWTPTVYTTAVATPENVIIPTASYEVIREIDNLIIIPHGTGSTMHTIMSYDTNGNYFDLDMKNFEPGYSYKIKVSFYDSVVGSYNSQPYEFKFRVRENVY